jgi:hypothetical protein
VSERLLVLGLVLAACALGGVAIWLVRALQRAKDETRYQAKRAELAELVIEQEARMKRIEEDTPTTATLGFDELVKRRRRRRRGDDTNN